MGTCYILSENRVVFEYCCYNSEKQPVSAVNSVFTWSYEMSKDSGRGNSVCNLIITKVFAYKYQLWSTMWIVLVWKVLAMHITHMDKT